MDKPNRPGRPTIGDDEKTSTQVTVRLTTRAFDQLYHRATLEHVSVAERIRRDIRRATDPE